jgi:integrase
MTIRLVGVHKVKAKRANGDEVTYYYAWRGGPRMKSKPNTHAFNLEFARLTKERPREDKSHTMGWLVEQYLKSADFQKLRPSTKRDYERIADVIRAQFGTLPLGAVEAKGARRLFMDWRDTMRSTPRSADLTMAVLARVISWAKNRELVIRNPLERIGKLHSSDRRDAIWMPAQLEKLMNGGRPHIVNVVKLALWTMQRQGDVLTMPTLAYDGGRLWITQGKTGARVRVKPADEIVPLLDEAKAKQRQRILVNSAGDQWTSSGFRASWRSEMKRLEISGVTFHDLRGTGISYAYAMGADVEQIAEISGHSKSECEAIIRRHYLAGGDVIEAIRAGTQR